MLDFDFWKRKCIAKSLRYELERRIEVERIELLPQFLEPVISSFCVESNTTICQY